MPSDIELEILRKRGHGKVPQGSSDVVSPDAIAAFVRYQRSSIEFSKLLLNIKNVGSRPNEADPLIDRGAILATQVRDLALELNQYPGVSFKNSRDSENTYLSDIASVAEEAYRRRISELVEIRLHLALEAGLHIEPDVLRLRWTEVETTNKLVTYLLNDTHTIGKHKAVVFKAALGFTASNAAELANQIKFDPNKRYTMKRKTWVDHDQVRRQAREVSQILVIKGINGRHVQVKCGWMIYPDGNVQLKTAIPLLKNYV
jgi:hypothetical protein